MKKIFTLLSLTCSCLYLSTAMAQNRYRDQNIAVGMGGITGKKGYFISLGYQQIVGFQGWNIKLDGIYANQYAKISNDIPLESKLPMQHYMILPSALYTFDQWGLDPFYFNLYGGAMLGYEVLNNGKKVLTNSNLESENIKNSFIYGISLGTIIEAELTRNLTLGVDARQLYRRGSKAGEFTFYLGAGIRYYIN